MVGDEGAIGGAGATGVAGEEGRGIPGAGGRGIPGAGGNGKPGAGGIGMPGGGGIGIDGSPGGGGKLSPCFFFLPSPIVCTSSLVGSNLPLNIAIERAILRMELMLIRQTGPTFQN